MYMYLYVHAGQYEHSCGLLHAQQNNGVLVAMITVLQERFLWTYKNTQILLHVHVQCLHCTSTHVWMVVVCLVIIIAYLPSLTHWACDTRISTKSHAHTHQAQNLTHSANYYKISRFEQQNRTCASICTARSVRHYISLQSRLTWLPGHTAHAHTKQAAALGSAAQRMQVAKLVNCVLCTRVELVRGAPWLKTIHVIRCTTGDSRHVQTASERGFQSYG